jgi:hypothetical protein
VGDISEIQAAKKWIYDSLVANADITGVVSTRIYSSVADSTVSAVFPYIVYTFIAGTDVDGLGVNRILSLPLFQVLVVSDRSPDTNVRRVDKRISDVLGVAVHQASGDWFFSARREQPIDRVFTDSASRNFYSLGGLFRLYIGDAV